MLSAIEELEVDGVHNGGKAAPLNLGKEGPLIASRHRTGVEEAEKDELEDVKKNALLAI